MIVSFFKKSLGGHRRLLLFFALVAWPFALFAAITYQGDATDGGTGTTASVTHGISISSGDLVVAYINSNSTSSMSPDGGGAAWSEVTNRVPPNETAREGFYYKIAGAGEPATYSFSVGNAEWRMIVKVYRSDGGAGFTLEISNQGNSGAATQAIEAEASNNQTPASDELAVVCGGKDNRSFSNKAYEFASESFINVVGNVQNQACACSDRNSGFPTTLGAVFMNVGDLTDDMIDLSYSTYVSFSEGGGPPPPDPSPVVLFRRRGR